MDVDISRTTCGTCGVIFWLTQNHKNQLLETRNTFYCPNGHSQWFPPPENDPLEVMKKNFNTMTLRASRLASELDALKNENRKKPCPKCGQKVVELKRHLDRVHGHKAMSIGASTFKSSKSVKRSTT